MPPPPSDRSRESPPTAPPAAAAPVPTTVDEVLGTGPYLGGAAAHSAGSAAATPLVPGYVIEGELGRGGMGVVYKARHLALKRTVALKMILHAGHAGATERARFQREAEAVARLQHANIVQIHEVGEHDGLLWFSLEFVEGGSLADRLRGVPLAPRPAAELVEVLSRAVHFAHERGVVHRDLKPANVLLTRAGGAVSDANTRNQASTAASHGGGPRPAPAAPGDTGTPKITDFGLAKHLDDDSGQTRSGAVMGTPSYMAPEQAEGKVKELGPLVDVYALGAILYECLTGRPPFKGSTLLETLEQVRTREPVPVRSLSPSCPRDLETICLKCLQKAPGRRYDSAAALADDLRRFLENKPILARPVGALERGLKWARRSPAVAGLLALIVVLTAAGGVLLTRAYLAAEQKAADERKARGDADDARKDAEAAQKEEAKAAQKERDAAAEARRQEDIALTTAGREREAKLRAQRNLSLLNLNSAWLAVVAHDPAKADRFLDACPPEQRSWDWHHLRHLREGDLMPLSGDGRHVRWAAFRPDGRTLALGNADGTVTVWDLALRRPARTWEAHAKGVVLRVAYLPDGRLVTLSTGDGRTEGKVWDPAGRPLAQFRVEGQRTFLAVSRDGSRLALPAGDGAVLRDAEGKELARLAGAGAVVSEAAFSPDGRRLLTVGGGVLRTWDVATGGEVASRPDGHGGGTNHLAVTSEGGQVTGGADHHALFTGRRAGFYVGHTGPIESVALSPDGQHFATGSADRTVRVWQIETNRTELTLRGHNAGVGCLAYSPDGRLLASVSSDGMVRLWDARGGPAVRWVGQHGQRIHALAFQPGSGRLLVSGDDAGFVRGWDADVGHLRFELRAHPGPVTRVAASAHGRRFYSAGHDGVVRLWQVDPLQLTATIRCNSPVLGLALRPDGRVLATGDRGGQVRLWDALSGEARGTVRAEASGGVDLDWSPDGRRLLSAGYQSFQVFDVETGRSVCRVDGLFPSLGNIAFHPDGRRVVGVTIGGGLNVTLSHYAPGSLEGAGAVVVWDAETGQELLRLRSTAARVAVSPDGKRLVGLGRNETVVWDADSGQEALAMQGAGDGVDAAAFAPSRDDVGFRLAVTTSNPYLEREHNSRIPGELRLWEGPTRHASVTLRQHTDAVRQLGSGGGRLLSGAPDSARLWDARTGEALFVLSQPVGVQRLDGAALRADGKRLAVALSFDPEVGEVTVFDPEEGEVLRLRDEGDLRPVAYSPDGRRLLTCRPARPAEGQRRALPWEVKLWDAETGRALLTYRGHDKGGPATGPHAAVWSPDGKRVASWGTVAGAIKAEQQGVRVWEAEGGRDLFALPRLGAPAFSADGTTLAAVGPEGVELFDAATGARRPGPPLRPVPQTVAFAPDGRCLAGAGERAVIVWELATGQALLTLREPKLAQPDQPAAERVESLLSPTALHYLADGRLAVGFDNGTVRLYELPLRPASAGVEVRASAGLSPYLFGLGVAHYQRGLPLALCGRHDLAGADLEEALAVWDALARDFPDSWAYAWGVAVVAEALADGHEAAGRAPRAAELRARAAATKRVLGELPRTAPRDAGMMCLEAAVEARRKGERVATADLFGGAVKYLGPLRQANLVDAQLLTSYLNALSGHAGALSDAGRHREALAAWDEVLKLARPEEVAGFRMGRALAQARSGDHAAAVAEADALTRGQRLPPAALYGHARVLSRAAATARADQKLSGAERERLAKQHLDRAVALLRQAQAGGFFKDAVAVERLLRQDDFEALRAAPEGMKLLDELSPKKPN